MIWFHVKCLEVIFIKVLVKGYLKNINENVINSFEYKGIKNKNKITYIDDDNVKFTIKFTSCEVIIVRDGKDFVNTFVFDVNKNKSISNYFIKDNNCDVDIDIKTIDLEIFDNIIYVKYLIVDTECIYEYKLEMRDVLWV